MKGINKIGMIITKILEVFHWVGAALMLGATICSVTAPDFVKYFVSFDAKECCGANLTVYGFEVNAPVVKGSVEMTSFFIFGIGAVIILTVMAMVFRNLYLIFKNSENATPFQKDNVRLVREIGIFAIAMDVDASGLPFLKNANPPAGKKSVDELHKIVKMVNAPFIVKGVMTVRGALKAEAAGADAAGAAGVSSFFAPQPAREAIITRARAIDNIFFIFLSSKFWVAIRPVHFISSLPW